jgi:hypothetical protein
VWLITLIQVLPLVVMLLYWNDWVKWHPKGKYFVDVYGKGIVFFRTILASILIFYLLKNLK